MSTTMRTLGSRWKRFLHSAPIPDRLRINWFGKCVFCSSHEFGPPWVDGDAFEVAVSVFSGGICADGCRTGFWFFAVFFIVIILTQIRFRTINEHIRPVPDPSMIGSYFESSCRALFMIMQNTIDRTTINNLQLGKILRMQQRIPKNVLSSERSSFVIPISARNGINPKWLIFKKLELSKWMMCVFLNGFDVVFVCCLEEVGDVWQGVNEEWGGGGSRQGLGWVLWFYWILRGWWGQWRRPSLSSSLVEG